MVYRILLVSTDAAAGCGLQAVLNQAGDGCFVVECLDRLDDAVMRAQAGGLDIALFEQSLYPGTALTNFELLSRIAAAVPLMLYRALGDGRDSRTTQAFCALIPADRLAHEHAHAQIILDSIGAAVVTTDLLGRVDYLNRAAQRISGWTLERARGHSIAEVMPPPDGDCYGPGPRVPMPACQVRDSWPSSGRPGRSIFRSGAGFWLIARSSSKLRCARCGSRS